MKYVLSLISAVLLISCTKPKKQTNEITKVELARSGAWSDQEATISIDSSLSYKYYGDYMKVKQGYFIGKISPQFWDTINQKLEKINFKTVPLHSKSVILDAGYFELVIYWKNGKRRITRYWDGGQEPVTKLFNELSDSFKNVKLEKVNTPFKFETTAHRPPKPKIDEVRFPPPIKQQH